MPMRPHTLDISVMSLVFTSVDCCRRSLQSNSYSRSILEEAYCLAKAYKHRTRAKLLQSAINKYDQEVMQELQP